jgi:hypothetical protein
MTGCIKSVAANRRGGWTRLRKALLKSSLLGVSILLALALAEGALRWIGYPNPLDYDPMYQASPVPGLVYEMKPGFRGRERYGVPASTTHRHPTERSSPTGLRRE